MRSRRISWWWRRSCWRSRLTHRAAGGRPRARGAARSTVPRSTVPRRREDSPLPGSTSTSATAAVNDSTRSSRATEPRPQSPRWDSRALAGHESVSRSGMNPAERVPASPVPAATATERSAESDRSATVPDRCEGGRSASSESPPRAGRSGRTPASGQIRAAPAAGPRERPPFSPDGERIAFVSDRDRNGGLSYGDRGFFANELYVMAADGGDQRRLTRTRHLNEAQPSWLPGGTRLAFQRGEQIQRRGNESPPDQPRRDGPAGDSRRPAARHLVCESILAAQQGVSRRRTSHLLAAGLQCQEAAGSWRAPRRRQSAESGSDARHVTSGRPYSSSWWWTSRAGRTMS
jgi:WD40-like Beta Propeller Repeat